MTTPQLVGPWLVLVAGGVLALVSVLADHVRLGGYLLAGALGTCAVLRALLPTRLAGGVAVRSRSTDLVLLVMSALAVAVVTYSLNLAPT